MYCQKRTRLVQCAGIETVYLPSRADTKYLFCAQYLNMARALEGYGELVLPHCPCDAYRDGHVIPRVGWRALRLQACTAHGALLVRVHFSLLLLPLHPNA